MRSQKNKSARQLLAFYEDPLNRNIIEEVSICGRYNPCLWHLIFLHFFYCGPVDPEDRPVKEGQPFGSNDPKWDVLFGELKAIKAQTIVLRLIRARTNNEVSKKAEKAA